MGMHAAIDLWTRQPGEGAKAFSACSCFRDMGPERSLRAVAQKCNKSVSLLARWSAKYRWVERCQAFDDHQDAIELAAWDRQCAKTARRHADVCMAILGRGLEKIAAEEPSTYEAAVNQVMLAMKYERICRGLPSDDSRSGRDGSGDADPDQSQVTRVTEVIVRTRADIDDLRRMLQPGQTLLYDPGPLPPEEPQEQQPAATEGTAGDGGGWQ
jgi:hypothetical protein